MDDFFNIGGDAGAVRRESSGTSRATTGLPDIAALKAFILGAQQTAAAYARNYGGTVKEIRKAQRVNDAFQRVLDDPAAAEALAASGAEAAARRGCRLAGDDGGTMSDHISGPRALADPIADITDVYAFPSPERPGHLVLVQNTLPFAPATGRFSDGLIYRFRLRPVRRGGCRDRRVAVRRAGSEELVFDCVFSEPTATGAQEGTCHTPSGETVAVHRGRRAGRLGATGFARSPGSRWDPFILDAPAALKTIATEQLAFTDPGSIYMDGKNVLSLVVEIDCAQVPRRASSSSASCRRR